MKPAAYHRALYRSRKRNRQCVRCPSPARVLATGTAIHCAACAQLHLNRVHKNRPLKGWKLAA